MAEPLMEAGWEGSTPGSLHRVLGLPFALLVVVGGSIGSGILRAPGPIATALPDPALILLLWTAGGLLALVEALPLLELAAALPRAGGPTVYVERAFGWRWGALVGWSSWLQCVVSVALLAVVAGEFAGRIGVPGPVPAVAVTLIALLTLLNLTNTRTNGGAQAAVQIAKLAGVVALTALIFAAPDRPLAATSTPVTAGGVALAAILINNAYQGWGSVVAFGEELREPVRTLKRALFGGIVLLTAIYLAMTAALLHALPVAKIASSTLPAADAVALIAGPAADKAITALSLLAVVSLANLSIMIAARILVAMARAGAMPALAARVETNGSPTASTLAGSIGAAVLASSGAYLTLNALYAPLAIFTAAMTMLAAIRLRRLEPSLPRPWRMPAYPLPVIISLAACLALLVAATAAAPRDVLSAALLLVLGAFLPLRRPMSD